MNGNFVNRGVNGATLSGVLEILKKERLKQTFPDRVIISAGANDLLFPHMQALGPEWNPFMQKLARHGSVPAADREEFKTLLEGLAAEAALWDCPFFFCTIPCLGENLESPLNGKKEDYNAMIRSFCREEESFKCIDGARSFEGALRPFQPGSSWLFRFPGDLIRDSKALARPEAEKELCRKRGLWLTIDGAHLNHRGAVLLAELGAEMLGKAG